jgi:hypothetical protein
LGEDAYDGSGGMYQVNTLEGIYDLFKDSVLKIDETYTVCERNLPAGWGSTWQIDTDGDGLISAGDTYVIPYNPDYAETPPEDYGNRCFNIGAGTSYPLPAPLCDSYINPLVMEVVNKYPGGSPRTPGYWKNWNTCTGGNQWLTAAENGGPEAGWFILDDILTDPGIDWVTFKLDGGDCLSAQLILDNRDLTGENMASDPAYNLAKHLLTYHLNLGAGSATCYDMNIAGTDINSMADIAEESVTLLKCIGFTGYGAFLKKVPGVKPDAEYVNRALWLANILDEYNNGLTPNSGYDNLCNEMAAVIKSVLPAPTKPTYCDEGEEPPVPVSYDITAIDWPTDKKIRCTNPSKLATEFNMWLTSIVITGGCDVQVAYEAVSEVVVDGVVTYVPTGEDVVAPDCEDSIMVRFSVTNGCGGFADGVNDWSVATFKMSNTKSAEIASGSDFTIVNSELKVYPNPFSDKVMFEFVAAEDARARLEITNILGQRVAVLMDQHVQKGVLNRLEYEPMDVVSQMLIYRLILDDNIQTGRIIYKKE